jgi:hypothetical protein
MSRSMSYRLVAGLMLIFVSWSFNDPVPLLSTDFSSPLNEVVRLSGSFGELRPNHFHEGIDIKGEVGTPVVAAADGYISRIGVSGNGYGKVLFVRHFNGFTSLYAHLQVFKPDVNTYVRKVQSDRKVFEVDLALEGELFPVRKGELIGYIGMTGSTQGPHLHFEIWDTETGHALNPLLMGVPYEDNIAPLIRQLKVYHLGPGLETLADETIGLTSTPSGARVLQDTLVVGAWRVGFGLKAFDRMDGSHNLNGIYSLDMYADGEKKYAFRMDRIEKQQTRYINAHLDYEEQVQRRNYINKCYVVPGNELDIYQHGDDDTGVVQLSRYKARHIRLVAGDLAGNTSEVSFWVKRGDIPERKPVVYNYVLPHEAESKIQEADMNLYFPGGTFYADLLLDYGSFADSSAGNYSRVHQLRPALTPVHGYFDMAIRPEGLPDALREKAFIGRCDLNNVVINYGGTWESGYLKARLRSFGDFVIMIDQTPPSIRPLNFASRHVLGQSLRFMIRDNVVSGGLQRGLEYSGSIDGEWILMEYDAKNQLLTHVLDRSLERGVHEFRLVVTDAMGNEQVFEKAFSY